MTSIRYVSLAFISCCLGLNGQDASGNEGLPRIEVCAPQRQEAKVVIPSLQGIRLVSSGHDVRAHAPEQADRVVVDDVDLPGSTQSLEKALSNYWDRPITSSDLMEIKRKLVRYYYDHNRPVVEIELPSQSMKGGVLQFVVYESRLGCVRSLCNNNFSNERLEGYIRTPSGARLNTSSLVSDLNWINRNPFRTTDLVFTASEKVGYTDIELHTVDQFPLRIFSGVDNTGIAQTGHNRYFAGFNWGNVFGLDHVLTYQFTTGTHYSEFWAHTGNYTIPLPWRHTVDFYGGYSQVKAALQNNPGMSTTGNSMQVSMRYEIPLPPAVSFLEEFTWGFDWKQTDTNLLNNDRFFFGDRVNITQLMVGFNAGLETNWTKNSWHVEAFYSPGRWFPDQASSRYNDLRPGAKNAYIYGRAAFLSIIRFFHKFTFEPALRMQFSSGSLLASEQFGLGGYDTVRGYEEREYNADNAIVANFEVRSPPISLLGAFRECYKCKYRDELRFLGFFDFGWGKNYHVTDVDFKPEYLLGVGPGLRYVIPKYLTVRLDYGVKLHQLKFGPNPLKHMLYFGVVLSI